VDDVEAELLQAWQLRLYAFEAAPRSREQLVPGAELRQGPVDLDRQRWVDALERGEQLGAERDVVLGRLGDVLVGQGGDRVLDQRLVRLGLGFARGLLQELYAFGKLSGQVVLL